MNLTTQGEIEAKPNQTPLVVPLTATLVFDLDFYALDEDCYLNATLSAVEPGPPPLLPGVFNPLTSLPQNIQDDITQYLTRRAKPFLAAPALPVGMGTLSKGARFINAGVSVDSGMQRLAFRAQVGGTHSGLDVPWSNFFKGFFGDRLQGSDWGFFVEAGLVTETIKALVHDALPKDDKLQAFPGCTYSNAGGKALLTIDVLLIYHLYRDRNINIDLSFEAHPSVDIALSVLTPNWLTFDFDFSHLLDSDDPLVNLGRGFVRAFSIPVEAMAFQLAGSAAMGELAKTPLEMVKQLSPTHIQCDKSIRVPQIPGALQTTMTSLHALDAGITLAGTMRVHELTAAVIQTSVSEFKKKAPSVSCGPASIALVAAFQADPSGFAVFHAGAFIANQGTAPLHLCGKPVVLRGKDGPYPERNIRIEGQQAPIQISAHIGAPSSAFYAAAYPLDLLVKTSGGTRVIRFNAPPPVTEQDYNALAAELLVKIGDCQQLVDPWFRLHRGYNPRWSPRPPEGVAVQHLWQVVVSGLPAGEVVALVDAHEQAVMTAVGTGSPVRLAAVVAPGGERDLTITRVAGRPEEDPTRPEPVAGQRGLEVRQTLLAQSGSIPLPARSQRLLVTSLFGGPSVLSVLDDGLVAFDFSNPHRPVLSGSWRIEGVRGVLNWQDGLLVFGHEGVEWIDRAGRRRPASTNCDLASIVDAAVDRQALYVLKRDAVDVYSPRLCRIGSVPLEGGRCIARVDRALVSGGRRGLTVFELTNPRNLHGERFLEDQSVTAVRATLAGDAGSFVAVLDDETARLFQAGERRHDEIGSYSGTPWFVDTVRIGDQTVKIGADRMSLDTYRIGESIVM